MLCFGSGLVGGGSPFVARVALLACIGGLAFVVYAFGGFLLWLSPAYVFLTIVSLCNSLLLRYNQQRNNRAIAPENKRGISREQAGQKHTEEARCLEVAQKIRGKLERDWSNSKCSALTSVQHLRNPAVPQPATPHAQDST